MNHFYITPSIPAGFAVSLSPGEFQASFHVANWSAIGAPDAPWASLPNGTAVGNGISPAPDKSTIEFACPPNTATTTCGIPTPTQTKQAVYVELKPAPGNFVPFTTAAAYANMEFKCLGCSAGGGTGGTGDGSAGASSGGSSVGGSGDATSAGGAPDAGARGALENAAGEAGSDAISSVGGAISGGGAASAGRSAGDAGASAANAANGGSAGSASSSSEKSGCNCALLAAPADQGCRYITLLALCAALARRRRRA